MEIEITHSSPVVPRWGTLGTVLWTLLLAALFVIVQSVVVLVAVQSENPEVPLDQLDFAEAGVNNGNMLALATTATTFVVLPLLLGVIKLKRGSKVADYFALRSVTLKTTLFWVAAALFLVAIGDVVKWLYGMPIMVNFVLDTYKTMGSVSLFFLAIVVLAPVTEELFCRGFMISGLQRGFIGPVGAVTLSSLLWAAMHVQYGIFDIAFIFMLGCLLGASRLLTGSIYPAIVAHVSINFLSYSGAAIYLELSST